jgi:hypothetical protein
MLVRRRFVTLLAVAASAAALLVSAGPAQATTISARSLLMQLGVRAENGSGYSRTYFSNGTWRDDNHDCQNTRAEVLIAESKVAVTYTSSSHCYVKAGRWYSWYDGRTWTLASDVDIDHVVPVKEAWDSGAKSWTSTDRTRYYNDLGYSWTLDAVTDNVNAAKGDSDPAQWLPPLTSARCGYAIHWVSMKYRWRLSIDSAEKSKLASILSGTCGSKTINIPPRAR